MLTSLIILILIVTKSNIVVNSTYLVILARGKFLTTFVWSCLVELEKFMRNTIKKATQHFMISITMKSCKAKEIWG